MASMETLGGLHYNMMRRCYNEKAVDYKDYGAKGITVCEEWHDREQFRKWGKENGWKKGLKLNRYDGKKNYCPENCYFGTKMSRNPNSVSQKAKRSIRENKEKKEKAGIIGKVTEDPLYATYISMHERCENPKNMNYCNYGGRGIKVCKEWTGKNGFLNFRKWANENEWAVGLTLDRKNNDKGYSPNNCRWATRLEQAYNRRNNIMCEYSSFVIPLGMVAKLEGVNYSTLRSNVQEKGMSVSRAIVEIKKSAV